MIRYMINDFGFDFRSLSFIASSQTVTRQMAIDDGCSLWISSIVRDLIG
jgi:hypothetical protein